MKCLFQQTLVILFGLASILPAAPQGAAFTYQGVLRDATGPANGQYAMQFALFDAVTNGNAVGSPIVLSPVAVSDGLFNVQLDFGAGAFSGNERWLNISVRTNNSAVTTFATLHPRQPLTAQPYAIRAAHFSGSIADTQLSPNVALLNIPNASTQATGVPSVTSGFITGAIITGGGSGYTAPPTVTVNDATGSGAVVIATVSGGRVTGLTVQNAGSGYTAGATLTIAAPPINASQTFVGVNYFTGANSLTNSGNVLAGNGSGLNNLNASSVSSGTVGDARLSANVALLNRTQTFSGTNAFTDAANSFTGDGAGLTGLNASSLTSGTISDSRLSANVARLNGANQIFTGPISFTHASNVFSGNFAGGGTGLSNVPLASLSSDGAIAFRPALQLVGAPATAGGAPVTIATADVNGDGSVDLVSNGGVIGLYAAVLTNRGDGQFQIASLIPHSLPVVCVAAADLDADGRVDLITANASNPTLSILINSGNGNFNFRPGPTLGANPSFTQPVWIVAADVNGDSRPDLVAAGGNALWIFTNNSSSATSATIPLVGGAAPVFVIASDFNGDGRTDFATANVVTNTLTVLTNNGAGGLAIASTLSVPTRPFSVAAADVNNDGRVDLISANDLNTGFVFTNGGPGGFALASQLSVPSPRSIATFDLNRDGLMDLVTANSTNNTISVLTNRGGGQFVQAASLSAGQWASFVTVADLNGDGWTDVISANRDDDTLSAFLNRPFHFSGTFDGLHSDGAGLTNISLSRLDAPDLNPRSALSVDNNGNISIAPGNVTLGSSLGQKLLLFGADWGFGIQSGALYSRVAAGGGFAWYAGGVHNDATYNSGGGSTRMTLDGGGLTVNGAFVSASDREVKDNFAPVRPSDMLEKVVALPISNWNFKNDPTTRHVGPMAQDFYAAFGVGPDDKHIATVDADGVALSAIQGLNQKLQEELQRRDAENAELKRRLTRLEKLLLER